MKNYFWSSLKGFVILAISVFFSACQVGREVRHEGLPSPEQNQPRTNPQEPGLPVLNSNGGSRTGGENGVESTGFENWRVDLEGRSEFRNQILPIITKLAVKVPRLAADLLHIARERKWYVVPAELDVLPAAQIGTRFRSEQLALHTGNKEIWISSLHYDKMNEFKKATLLMHELVMGVRLLDFQDKLDQCLAKATVELLHNTPEGQKAYKEAHRQCYLENSNPFDRGRELILNDEQHADIRDLTEKLMNKIDTIETYELEGWIKSRNFRHWN